MSKGFQKPNKDVRKPKVVKGKPPASQTSPFGARGGQSAKPKPGNKKGT